MPLVFAVLKQNAPISGISVFLMHARFVYGACSPHDLTSNRGKNARVYDDSQKLVQELQDQVIALERHKKRSEREQYELRSDILTLKQGLRSIQTGLKTVEIHLRETKRSLKAEFDADIDGVYRQISIVWDEVRQNAGKSTEKPKIDTQNDQKQDCSGGSDEDSDSCCSQYALVSDGEGSPPPNRTHSPR
jgi:hypothetical protein